MPRFADRTLIVDSAIADFWGRMVTTARRHGASIGVIDGLIGATAIRHGMIVVTRDTDFELMGAPVLNLWNA